MGRISFTVDRDKITFRKGAGSFSVPLRRETDDGTPIAEQVTPPRDKRTFAEFCEHVERKLSEEGAAEKTERER